MKNNKKYIQFIRKRMKNNCKIFLNGYNLLKVTKIKVKGNQKILVLSQNNVLISHKVLHSTINNLGSILHSSVIPRIHCKKNFGGFLCM